MTDISVVIPTYNRAATITHAIESVMLQDGANEYFRIAEIIVIDDCSDDNTAEVLTEFKKKNLPNMLLQGDGTKDQVTQIVYHKLDKNGGPGKARNEGVKLAKSEWVAFQDSDDLWHSNKLKEMITFMGNSPEADLYSHFYEAKLDVGRCITVDAPQLDDYFSELAKRNLVGAPTILVRKSSFMDIVGFDEEMRALEDWDFALRFAYKYKIMFVPKVLMSVDLTGEGVSSKAGNYYDARCRLIAKNKNALIERGVFKDAVEKLLNDALEKGILKEVGAVLESYLVV